VAVIGQLHDFGRSYPPKVLTQWKVCTWRKPKANQLPELQSRQTIRTVNRRLSNVAWGRTTNYTESLKPARNRPLRAGKRMWRDNIKMYLENNTTVWTELIWLSTRPAGGSLWTSKPQSACDRRTQNTHRARVCACYDLCMKHPLRYS